MTSPNPLKGFQLNWVIVGSITITKPTVWHLQIYGVRTLLECSMRKTLSRIGNSEALIITREMKELTGISTEVQIEIQGNAIIITPAEDAQRPEALARQERFAQARDQVLSEYDELFKRLADA